MKLIAVDLDGTLLTSDSRPSSQGLDAISHAVSKGHAVTLCTGRASFDARHLTGELSIPIIASNGAEVFDREGKLLREMPIDPGAAAEAVRYLLKHNVYFEIFCPEAIYSPSDGEQKLLAEMDMLVSANPKRRSRQTVGERKDPVRPIRLSRDRSTVAASRTRPSRI
ncbi:hypothetical protein HMSSN139_05160 [Paenibacillus sp. HMSSN-139]|nr:hypothetical protein HMSSN139_05160 [Paenibacillus sp. HMSSN-139]